MRAHDAFPYAHSGDSNENNTESLMRTKCSYSSPQHEDGEEAVNFSKIISIEIHRYKSVSIWFSATAFVCGYFAYAVAAAAVAAARMHVRVCVCVDSPIRMNKY